MSCQAFPYVFVRYSYCYLLLLKAYKSIKTPYKWNLASSEGGLISTLNLS